jgi:beta-aspartyl-peptidase (threonine type)
MILLASWNGVPGMEVGWSILSSGGSALDAVEAATREVEDDPADYTVGYGGLPNLLGEVELDASIMDGTTRDAGAVAGLKRYRAAITIARRVMEDLPHAVLVGDGAARFGAELGLTAENLLTEEARHAYLAGFAGEMPPRFNELPGAAAILETLIARHDGDRAPSFGTVNFIAQDDDGRIASATSSSGWPWKYPGRAGDSAVIGAGNYADDRYGAATCTGWGEFAIRLGTARSVIARIEAGQDLHQTCRQAFHDVLTLDPGWPHPPLSMLALAADGAHTGYSTHAHRTYLVRTAQLTTYAELPGTPVRSGTDHRVGRTPTG